MATQSIRIRAKTKRDFITVKTLLTHVMETGLRKNKKTGEKIPAHFIKEVMCEHNGKTVLKAKWGVAVSKNPYLSFNIDGGKIGDKIKVSWRDNQGESAASEVSVK